MNEKNNPLSFRPLDGESFSKLYLIHRLMKDVYSCFRPLDGESFSKPHREAYKSGKAELKVSVP